MEPGALAASEQYSAEHHLSWVVLGDMGETWHFRSASWALIQWLYFLCVGVELRRSLALRIHYLLDHSSRVHVSCDHVGSSGVGSRCRGELVHIRYIGRGMG